MQAVKSVAKVSLAESVPLHPWAACLAIRCGPWPWGDDGAGIVPPAAASLRDYWGVGGGPGGGGQ